MNLATVSASQEDDNVDQNTSPGEQAYDLEGNYTQIPMTCVAPAPDAILEESAIRFTIQEEPEM